MFVRQGARPDWNRLSLSWVPTPNHLALMKFVFMFFVITLCSCQTGQKFDKEKWSEVGDLNSFPNRKYMIDDLTRNQELKRKRYEDIISL
jgi:hypothetical protein